MKTPIYMDNHATTPLDPRVLEAMMPYLTEHFGNAASRSHPFGWAAEEASEQARERVAALIGGSGKEIVWTSGATESINLALKGITEFYKDRGNHVITAKTEHKAVLDTCKRLERSGCEVTFLDVDKHGRLDPEAVRAAITDRTVLVSVMAANNEIGTIHPIREIGAITREKGVFFHVDAAQAAGKVALDVNECNIDLASLSAHKMYGPKGVGALWVRRRPRVRLTGLIDGGGHERGMRSGTINVPGVVGFGMAAEIAQREMVEESARVRALRDRLQQQIVGGLDMVYLNGHPEHRLDGNLNLSFAFVEGEGMMMALKDVAVSSGSACTSASLEPSHVLRACGVEEDLAHTSIRFGLGRFNTEEEVDHVAKLVVEKVKRLRDMSPLYEMAKDGIDLKSIEWSAH
ncbi:IscS subfamily cysteine desulfurase [Vulgatibacter incomptus]|uniref:IscS subfamily cysteine desulfurase n=1 Tax=Vulgatibacter incomptus TaxID=1391653 RepID=UPI00068201DB|nr:IscS subfamily cysteine desulfurase [Vulgatibacter incomptus]